MDEKDLRNKLTIVTDVMLLLLMVAPTSGQDCSQQSVDRCSEVFTGLQLDNSSVVFLDDVLPSWDESILNYLCVYYDIYSVCMANNVSKYCTIIVQKASEGLDGAFHFLCNSTAEYVNYQPCFASPSLRIAVDSCNETLVANVAGLKYVRDENQKTTKYCTYHDEFMTCLSTVVAPQCGSLASYWQQNFTHKLFQPYLSYLGCPGWETDSGNQTPATGDWSTASIIIAVFIIFTILLMLIVIAVFTGVVYRRRKLMSGSASRRRRRRPGTTSGTRGDCDDDDTDSSRPPDYNAPYVVYGMPGPDGERRLRIVGLGDPEDEPDEFIGASPQLFKGLEPPPYSDQPPAFDDVAGSSAVPSASTATVNQAFVADSDCHSTHSGSSRERGSRPSIVAGRSGGTGGNGGQSGSDGVVIRLPVLTSVRASTQHPTTLATSRTDGEDTSGPAVDNTNL